MSTLKYTSKPYFEVTVHTSNKCIYMTNLMICSVGTHCTAISHQLFTKHRNWVERALYKHYHHHHELLFGFCMVFVCFCVPSINLSTSTLHVFCTRIILPVNEPSLAVTMLVTFFRKFRVITVGVIHRPLGAMEVVPGCGEPVNNSKSNASKQAN
jgi:hypothetical protein